MVPKWPHFETHSILVYATRFQIHTPYLQGDYSSSSVVISTIDDDQSAKGEYT